MYAKQYALYHLLVLLSTKMKTVARVIRKQIHVWQISKK